MFTCEVCNRPAGPAGITCDDCTRERVARCLRSAAWRRIAATRTGDRPGETMLDTFRRLAR